MIVLKPFNPQYMFYCKAAQNSVSVLRPNIWMIVCSSEEKLHNIVKFHKPLYCYFFILKRCAKILYFMQKCEHLYVCEDGKLNNHFKWPNVVWPFYPPTFCIHPSFPTGIIVHWDTTNSGKRLTRCLVLLITSLVLACQMLSFCFIASLKHLTGSTRLFPWPDRFGGTEWVSLHCIVLPPPPE